MRSLKLVDFAKLMFSLCDVLNPYKAHTAEIFKLFSNYKLAIPVNGAILLDESLEHVLVVRGWKSSANWGFPRGKVSKDEPESACAAREVEEEIGFNVRPYINEEDRLTHARGGQVLPLFSATLHVRI